MSFGSNSIFAVDIGGTTVSTQYDQLNVTGTVTIGANVALNLTQINSFLPAVGNTFTLLNNNNLGAISGTFNGLPEGAFISTIFGTPFSAQITYLAARTATPSCSRSSAPVIVVEQPLGTGLTAGVSTINFGSVNDSFSGTPKTFTIRNTGTAPLTLGAITKTGTNSADYSIDTSATSTTVAAGGSTTFAVTFTPSASGTRAATLHIASNDSTKNPFDIPLTGTGVDLAPTDIARSAPRPSMKICPAARPSAPSAPPIPTRATPSLILSQWAAPTTLHLRF